MATPSPLRAPRLQRLTRPEDLDAIRFEDGVALVEVNAELLSRIRFKNDRRSEDARLLRLRRSIRRDGYSSWQPITARIGQKGKWIIIDGGHRMTAIRDVMGDWWANLFGRKVRSVQFLLLLGPRSWRKARHVAKSAQRAQAETARAAEAGSEAEAEAEAEATEPRPGARSTGRAGRPDAE